MAAGGEPLVLLGDRSVAKTPLLGDSDSFRFRDCEYIEGMTLTQHLNQMKLFNAIATAAVIGSSFIAVNPAEAYSCFPYAAAGILERMLASGATFDMAIEQAWNSMRLG